MERHYTEQEVTEVIRRAAELQERLAEGPGGTAGPGGSAGWRGVGESELVRIAGELGLQEKFVREALADPQTLAVEDKGSVTAIDRTLERTAAGLPGSEAFEIALDEFGPSMGVQSGPTTVGDTMTYQSMVGLSHCDVLVSKKSGRTRIKIGVNTFLPLIAVALPVMMAVAFVAGSLGKSFGPVVGWSLVGLGLALDWALMRSIVAWSNMKVVGKLEGLVKRLDSESRKVSQQGGE